MLTHPMFTNRIEVLGSKGNYVDVKVFASLTDGSKWEKTMTLDFSKIISTNYTTTFNHDSLIRRTHSKATIEFDDVKLGKWEKIPN